MHSQPRARFPLLALSLLVLILATWAGLVRIGWHLPTLAGTLPAAHGPLMVSGFLGTLISLERAVAMAALGRRWTYVAPVMCGLGALAVLANLSFGPLLVTLGSILLLGVFVEIIRRQPAIFTVIMGLGAALWAVGNGLWLAGQPVFNVVWWWAGYLVLTIAGERLELSRMIRISRSSYALFLGTVGIYAVGLLLVFDSRLMDIGTRVVGLGLVAMAVWLLRYDIARRTVQRTGLTRFIAVNLLVGYVWLALSGLTAVAVGRVVTGSLYDAMLHTLFLGFVFGLIFGHAPVIFPAVLGVQITYSPVFYGHLVLLHLSLVLRVIGDLARLAPLRRWGAMLNALAMLLFLLVTIWSTRRQASPEVGDQELGGQKQGGQMKNRIQNPAGVLIGGILLGAVIGLILGLVIANVNRPQVGWEASTAATSMSPAGEKAVSGGVTMASVEIKDLAFSPHTVVVATGATITWHNQDAVAHTATSEEGWFDSGQISPGGEASWQANKPGTFAYHCDNHPGMEGVIVVQSGGAVAAAMFAGNSVDQYYGDSCGGCHGPHREGATGPALIPERLTSNDQFYFDTIKNGRPGTVMPAWGPAGLSDEEIWALVGFIRSETEAEDVQWEADQIAASREILVDESTLPDKPTHDGNLDNLLLVTEREARRIAVIDGDTHTLLGKIEASYRAHGYTFDPTNDRWAYNVGRDGWLFRIDLYTLQATAKVKIGLDSRGIAVSDDGRFVIVGNYVPATAVILNAETLEPLKVIHTDGNDPDGKPVHSRVCITSDVSPELVGPYFIIALKEAGQMWRIDWSKPDFPIDKVEGVGHILHDGFLSPDNTRFYIASQRDNWMGVIDVVNWKLVDKISTGTTPHPGSGAAWRADDGHIYGATTHAGEGKIAVWDLADDRIAAQIPTAGPGLFIRSSEHSPYVWADSMFAKPANHIYVFDKNPPFDVVKVIEEGTQPLHPEFTADGKFVYVADWQDNVVRVYNATTFEKVAEITGIEAPTGIFNTERRLEPLGH